MPSFPSQEFIPGLYQSGDLLVVLYLLSTPALALIIGASASGSPYSSVGLSREMTMMLAYEIPLLIVFLTVGMRVGMGMGGTAVFSLSGIVNFQLSKGALLFDLPMLPAFLAFLICIPGTLGVVPFDIPEAETEITEGPLLEYSGSGLAMFKLTGGLKTLVLSRSCCCTVFPAGSGQLLAGQSTVVHREMRRCHVLYRDICPGDEGKNAH